VERFFREGKLSWYHKAVFPVRFPLMWAARNRSFSDYLDKYVSNPELKSILSVFCGYYGLPPARLSGFYYMNATGGYFRHGGSYPCGGSIAISNALADYITNRGGEVLFSTTAQRVQVENGKAVGIQTADGKTLRSRMVAANCSALRLFNDMVAPEHVPKEYRDQIHSFKPSISSFQVWLALNKDITAKVKDSHIFLAPEPDPAKAFEHSLHARADKVNLGVCIYNNIYKDYSPAGTTVLSLVFGCGYEPWAGFEKDYWAGKKDDYTAKKREIADMLVRRVEEVLIPDLSNMIVVRDAATPLTNMRYTLNTQGAIYGFEQSLNNSFMNRLSNRTPIKGLYMAGAWGEPGGGYSGVLISGKRTFGMLMEDWGK
jgi:phytoene dehydrogenase-like protein